MVLSFIHIPKNGGSSIRELLGKYKDLKIVYRPHNVDVFKLPVDSTIVVLRDPVDRFCSAFYWAMDWAKYQKKRQKLQSLKIDTANKFAEILANKNHPHYKFAYAELTEYNQYIGSKKSEFGWIWAPQSLWIHQPKYIILFEHFEEEIHLLFQKLGASIQVEKTNSSKRLKNENLSSVALDFIKDFYKQDFTLLEEYRKQSRAMRLKI